MSLDLPSICPRGLFKKVLKTLPNTYRKMANRERFLKLYANLPLNLRKETILVLDEKGPITWDVAYLEVENKTKVGDIILNKLAEMDII